MKELKDTDIMLFGKYKGVRMQDVPASYLHWLWQNGLKQKVQFDAVANYIYNNISALKIEFPDGIWS